MSFEVSAESDASAQAGVLSEIVTDLRANVESGAWQRVDADLASFSSRVAGYFVTHEPNCIERSEALLVPVIDDLRQVERHGRRDAGEAVARRYFARGLLTLMRQTRDRLEHLAAQHQSLSQNEAKVLTALLQANAPLINAQVAETAGLRTEVVSRTLGRLEASGCLKRYRVGKTTRNEPAGWLTGSDHGRALCDRLLQNSRSAAEAEAPERGAECGSNREEARAEETEEKREAAVA